MSSIQEELMELFDFTADDLKSNQRGRISSEQRYRLRVESSEIQTFTARSAVIASFGLCLILILVLQNERIKALLFSNPTNNINASVEVSCAVLIFAVTMLLTIRRAGALAEARLLMVEGRASFSKGYSSTSGETKVPLLGVGDMTFELTKGMKNVFLNGKAYRIYYCKSGPFETILSVEVIAGTLGTCDDCNSEYKDCTDCGKPICFCNDTRCSYCEQYLCRKCAVLGERSNPSYSTDTAPYHQACWEKILA